VTAETTEPQAVRGRIRYDLFWGALLAASCFLPATLRDDARLWHLVSRHPDPRVRAWLLLAPVAALAALLGAWSGWRSRMRHLLNFALGAAQLALPLFAPAVWQAFPTANPAALPLGDLGEMSWVVLVAMTAIYVGSGIRVARPSQVVGQAFAALGALLLAIFSFLPPSAGGPPFAVVRFGALADFAAEWRDQLPFVLMAGAAVLGTLNLTRTRAEVFFAGVTRLLMVAGLLFWIVRPFLEGGAPLRTHVPEAWGALRFLGPWFLALDGAVTFVAISITRSDS